MSATLALMVGPACANDPGPVGPDLSDFTRLTWRVDGELSYALTFVFIYDGSVRTETRILRGTMGRGSTPGPHFVGGEDAAMIEFFSGLDSRTLATFEPGACHSTLSEVDRCPDSLPIDLRVSNLQLGLFFNTERLEDSSPAKMFATRVFDIMVRYFQNGQPEERLDENLLATGDWPLPTLE
ncbi:MAG: hypothetical protein AAGF12_25815 [Myxococcota bacterium]